MKKFMTMMLGLSLFIGATAIAFAGDDATTKATKAKKTKKAKKTTDNTTTTK